jgi:hypothetical protein
MSGTERSETRHDLVTGIANTLIRFIGQVCAGNSPTGTMPDEINFICTSFL